MQHEYDAIVIGGSFAGLSAAMQLARGRRSVCVIDAGKPRNRFADESHGFFGRDGAKPLEMIAEARADLLAYPSVRFIVGEAINVARCTKNADDADNRVGSFSVNIKLQEASSEGSEVEVEVEIFGKKLVLACGVTDTLPDIPGVQERWGSTVLHCPYCHGYEFGGQAPLGVLNVMPLSIHQALIIPEWGPTYFFLNGGAMPDEETLRKLRVRGVTIVQEVVTALEPEGLRLADGRLFKIAALYLAPKTNIHPIAVQLGCTMEKGPFGPVIKTNESMETTVSGVYAAGDASRILHNATLASADGVVVGVFLHRALVQDSLV